MPYIAGMQNEPKMHPFERSGLGVGPFRCIAAVSLPSPSLAEKNPQAYQNAMRDLPRGVGLGTCAHCGLALINNFIIESADKHRFSVGCECVHKTGDKALGDAVAIAAARLQRDKRRAKAEAARKVQHEAWLAAVCHTGETNAARLVRQEAERQAATEAAKAAQVANAARYAFLLPVLENSTSGFCQSIAEGIRNGQEPRGRAVDILRDIFAKSHGRSGSKAYLAAVENFNSRLL